MQSRHWSRRRRSSHSSSRSRSSARSTASRDAQRRQRQLSAGNASVASCQVAGATGTIRVAYDTTIPGYKVSTVNVNAIGRRLRDEVPVGPRSPAQRTRTSSPSRATAPGRWRLARTHHGASVISAAAVTGSRSRSKVKSRFRTGGQSCGQDTGAVSLPATPFYSTEDATDMTLLAKILGLSHSLLQRRSRPSVQLPAWRSFAGPLCRQHLPSPRAESASLSTDAQRRNGGTSHRLSSAAFPRGARVRRSASRS